MRLIRALAALVLLRAGFWRLVRAENTNPTRYRPVERMLVGSIVGLGICTLWIWLSERAGR